MSAEPSGLEWRALQEQECRGLLELLREVGIASTERSYPAGEEIYEEGEYGDALYIVREGVVKLFRPYSGTKEATLRLLTAWEIFGHLAFAGETVQRAYAEAVTPCRIVKVPKVFVERAIRREPEVALKIMTLLELRLVQYEELVKTLLPRETRARLASLLPLLAQKFGSEGEAGITIDLRLTHQDLAAMVASTRESVTKVLNDLRSQKVISIERGRITIISSERLSGITRP